MKVVKLRIDQLLLDSENPRIGSATSQRDALQKVLDDQETKLFNLAESIADDGLSPIETIMVVREKVGSDRFIALEGNRRVAALKLLINPHQLADMNVAERLQKRFETLARRFDRATLEPLNCAEAKDRLEAQPWLRRRHIGEDEGRGIVSWSGMATRRFAGKDPALQALDFVRNCGGLNADQLASLDSFPITTLDRLLSTVEVRQLIGVDISDRTLQSSLHPDELIKPLRRMVLDLAGKVINVSELKNKAQQLAYIRAYAAGDKPNLSSKATLRSIQDIKANDFTSKPTAKPAGKRRPIDPADRKTVVAPRSKVNVTDNKVADIFKELRKLRVIDNPNACAVLLRVFLELSVDCYLETNNISARFKDTRSGRMLDKNLKQKVSEAIDHIVDNTDTDKRDFRGVVRSLSVDHSPLSIDLLHAYVHNRFVTPNPRELLSAWNNAQRFFERMWP